jgi:rhomboid-like protein
VVIAYEDLPPNYKDTVGLSYSRHPLTAEQLQGIFPQHPAKWTDSLLRILHGRRVAGTLEDPSLPMPPVAGATLDEVEKSLGYLRDTLPIDEVACAGKRAEEELKQLEYELYLKRGEKLGLIKRRDGDSETPEPDYAPEPVITPIPEPILHPQELAEKEAEKKPTGLQALREQKRKEWDEKLARHEAAEAERLAKIQQNIAETGIVTHDERGVELRRAGSNPKLQEYLERAQSVVPDAPPEMPAFKRLAPSGLACVLVLLGCAALSALYEAPKRKDRLFPDIPPAAATIAAIIGANVLVFALWHHPPAWRFLNKYFLTVSGYPRAASVIGAAFSHQSFKHLAMNMICLWFLGTQLHDIEGVGRGNFLAIYLASCAVGGFGSLAWHVGRGALNVSMIGASTGVCGVLAAFTYLGWNNEFRVFGVLPPPPYSGIPGWAVLGVAVSLDLVGLVRKKMLKLDHAGHLGGYAGGLAMLEYIKSRNGGKLSKRREHPFQRVWT